MKISYNWLKDYVQTDLSVDEISKILTETGLEVDGVEKVEAVKGGLEGVVVGEVLTCEKHPDADKLKVTTVTVGGEAMQIVCGAPNVAAGQKVIVATVGCTLYPKPDEAFKIKASKIRGQESNGMLCAEDELGLGESHAGILVLPQDTPVGLPASKYFDLEDDYVIEIGLTPNRADAMGHIGVARDLIAYLNYHKKANLSLQLPTIKKLEVKSQDLKHTIEIQSPDLCPKYFGVSLKNIKIEASPAWLQKRLRVVGLSPINNVVDCTNYVMRELGTPLHAFDCAKLGGKIVVKTASAGQVFTTLDGVERKLDTSNLMITNGVDNLAIAGVFGGLESGISDNTTNIFIESAYFNPVSVRKTAKMHALNTDASFRYERGVDPHLTRFALERVVNLIQEVAGGEIAMDVLEIAPTKIENVKVNFRPNHCNKVIGTTISEADMAQILGDLDIQIIAKNADSWTLEIPAYRVDVTREIDVVEEILRIYGFNQVPLPEKLNSNLTLSSKPNLEKIQQTISELLVGNGFSEMMNNSLTSSTYLEKTQQTVLLKEHNVEMLNPLSQDLDVMRQTLIFNSLEVFAHNQNRQNSDLKLFEFGKIYRKVENKYEEEKRLILVLSGSKYEEQWNNSKDKVSFFTLKGIVNSVLSRLGLNTYVSENAITNSLLADGINLSVLKDEIGQMGWISPALKKQFGIKNDVFIADLSWDAICKNLKLNKVLFKEIPKTFEMRRDFSLLLDEKVRFSEIEKIAKAVDKKLLKSVGLFDVYEGKNLDEGKKSYAVSFYFQDNEQTLKDQTVENIMTKIRSELEGKLGAELR
ncbi:MAG: phenylalanine--tRNA ligase subunit beta [Flavobacteriia bacterium]|jgi:phenylalanyl-tRNA synthetase beta chain